jgi:hypothetical protein
MPYPDPFCRRRRQRLFTQLPVGVGADPYHARQRGNASQLARALNPVFIFLDNVDEGRLWVNWFPQLNGFRDMGLKVSNGNPCQPFGFLRCNDGN